ncbi:unnamed protein product [Caretta caretta]
MFTLNRNIGEVKAARSRAAVVATLRVFPSTPEPDNKEKEDDMFSKILSASAASDCGQRGWRMNTADCMKKERADRRKAQESQQEKKREMQQDIMELFWHKQTCCRLG